MKIALLFIILLAVILSACTSLHAPPEVSTTQPSAAPSVPPATEPSTEPPTEPPATKPLHSPLYLPDVAVEDVIRYFNEVCLDAEFVNNGNASVVQKWAAPIRYILHGDATNEDVQTLSAFTAWLNTIDGFPGISQTADPDEANLRIHFCSEDGLLAILGNNFYGTDGGVTFWYRDDEIYDAVICYRTDLDQALRNSVILEEIYNGLGPVQDTDLRPDSIIYSGFSQPQALTQIDELILRLLYHPRIKCGMSAAECEAVIRQLYY